MSDITQFTLFPWERFDNGEIIVHCSSTEDANIFLSQLYATYPNYTWKSGAPLLDEAYYDTSYDSEIHDYYYLRRHPNKLEERLVLTPELLTSVNNPTLVREVFEWSDYLRQMEQDFMRRMNEDMENDSLEQE